MQPIRSAADDEKILPPACDGSGEEVVMRAVVFSEWQTFPTIEQFDVPSRGPARSS